MIWRGWEDPDPTEQFRMVEFQTIEPLTRAAVGCTTLKNMLRDWEEEDNAVLDEKIATHLKNEIVSCAENVYLLANTAQCNVLDLC